MTLHCPADLSLLHERSWVVNIHTGFGGGLADEEKMNGSSPIIQSSVAPNDNCWFNKDCLVLKKEITGLTESRMQPDCGNMLSGGCFAEEEWCTPIIMTESKVFGMLQFSKAMYSSSRSWFLDSLVARWPTLQPMLNRNSVNLTSFESLLSFGKKKSTAEHRRC